MTSEDLNLNSVPKKYIYSAPKQTRCDILFTKSSQPDSSYTPAMGEKLGWLPDLKEVVFRT